MIKLKNQIYIILLLLWRVVGNVWEIWSSRLIVSFDRYQNAFYTRWKQIYFWVYYCSLL